MGNRVRKDGTGSTEFYYFGSQLLATLDPGSGSWNDYIYGAGRLLAENAGQPTAVAQFRIGDSLDSLNLLTDGAGNPTGNFDFAPYGQLFNNTASDLLLFTDHERDTESNSDHTQYRQLSLAQSRWFTPDPYDGSYNLADPQSLNRYAYLDNRPLSATDPNGLDGGGSAVDLGGCVGAAVQEGLNPISDISCGLGLLSFLFGGGGPGVINEHYGQVVGVNDDAGGATSGSPPSSGEAAPLDDNADLYTVGPDLGSFGESLGIPKGLKVDDGGILGILGLPSPGCEFGACGFQSGITQAVNDGVQTYIGLIEDLGQFAQLKFGAPKRLFGTQYCGPGGAGSRSGNVNSLCAIHDDCYAKAGFSALANVGLAHYTQEQAAAAKSCNEDLYYGLQKYSTEPGAYSIRAC